jgi:hypothetical protein
VFPHCIDIRKESRCAVLFSARFPTTVRAFALPVRDVKKIARERASHSSMPIVLR